MSGQDIDGCISGQGLSGQGTLQKPMRLIYQSHIGEDIKTRIKQQL